MENKKYLDLNKYKMETDATGSENPPSATPEKAKMVKAISKTKKITKSTTVRDEDGNELTIADFYMAIEDGDRVMVHCPISPESHNNNDANASCSMQRNGDYLNLNCFGCNSKTSVFFGKAKTKSTSKNEFEYSVPHFNKEDVIHELSQGLNDMSAIVSELVRLLPALEKKEKNDD